MIPPLFVSDFIRDFHEEQRRAQLGVFIWLTALKPHTRLPIAPMQTLHPQ
ncbi:hypothetical protein GGD50_000496 [Rhizobium paranaense]|uniref:Uncharacterized protein n=1 Tax=Rhizobium paranaense TaxID=1650438 RepID=A0A7W8XMB9_9HYPH|nr:hypothetical protein [Rhizobium paranaense]